LESFNKAPQYDYQWKELSQTPAFIPTYRVSNGCGDEGPWNMKINDQLCWKSSQKKGKKTILPGQTAFLSEEETGRLTSTRHKFRNLQRLTICQSLAKWN